MHQLVISLGRTQRKADGYTPATYCFHHADGQVHRESTSFFGLALLRWLQQVGRPKVDRLLILGTAGSMWEAWLDGRALAGLPAGVDDLYLSLGEKSDHSLIEEPDLLPLTETLRQQLQIDVACRLVSNGSASEDHLNVLHVLDEETPAEALVSLDFTHAFRHLPLLQLMALQHLHLTKKCQIEGVWYGMFEFGQDEHPAVKLDLVTSFFNWTEAVTTARSGLRLGAISKLDEIKSRNDGSGSRLSELELYLRSNRADKAMELGKRLASEFRSKPLNGLGSLFQSELLSQMEWLDDDNLACVQAKAAVRFLRCDDFVRAAILAYEALVTAATPKSSNLRDFAVRERVAEVLKSQPPEILGRDEYRMLRVIRNNIAHGTRASKGASYARDADEVLESNSLSKIRSDLGRLVHKVHDKIFLIEPIQFK